MARVLGRWPFLVAGINLGLFTPPNIGHSSHLEPVKTGFQHRQLTSMNKP